MIEKEAAEGGTGSPRAADAKEMRAVVLSAFGGLNKLRVSKKVMPEPQEGELKIRVKAWSSIARSLFPHSPPPSKGISFHPLPAPPLHPSLGSIPQPFWGAEKQGSACQWPSSQWRLERSLLLVSGMRGEAERERGNENCPPSHFARVNHPIQS